ncbi:MAG: hypothetical protein AB1798_21860, partial [Spirochaetota bacterium]
MTGRERLLRVLRGEKVDRIPNAPFIFYNFIEEFFETSEALTIDARSEQIDMVEKGIEVYEHFGFDIILRTANAFEYLNEVSDEDGKWMVSSQKTGDDKNWQIVTTIKTPEKILTQKKNYSQTAPHEVVEALTEYFLKDKDDFEQFVKYRPRGRMYDTSDITRAKKVLGDRGLVAPWAQGAFNSVSFFRNAADLMMDPY